jgi:hypothetical protein
MNQQDKIDLSKRIASKYFISANKLLLNESSGAYDEHLWLADDDARCFRLALDNNVQSISYSKLECDLGNRVSIYFSSIIYEHLDFSYEMTKAEATRTAILKCLDAMKG